MEKNCLPLLIGLGLLLHACHVTYYQKHAQFHKLFLAGKLAEADALLAEDKRAEKKKTRLLHYCNRGLLAHQLGRYEESNHFFEQAHLIHENFLAKPVDEALALVINATVTDYRGEDHEALLVHYYKALNFLQLGKNNEALVECRRLNIKLNQLSDKYTNPKKYRRDAFIHILMGLVYQANHDYNNAFIAYRNAVEIYQEDYKQLFSVDVPAQLKKDLIYTAYKAQLYDQMDKYRKALKLQYDPTKEEALCDVVFLWNNGLGPLKDEWVINFVMVPGAGGVVTFRNEELGLFFPFMLPEDDPRESAIANLKFIRVVFPKYQERPLVYDQACIVAPDKGQHTFELLEDVNAIAFHVLRERMVLELGKSLLRVALKQIAEYQLKKHNDALGIILGGINFLTEKADTRNWQTIPHGIYYTRIRLPEGAHQLNFKAFSRQLPRASQYKEFHLTLRRNKTAFQVIHSPATTSG